MTAHFRSVLAVLTVLLALAATPSATLAQPNRAVAATVLRLINLRAQPSTSAAIVGELRPGTTVTASARTGDWVRVTIARTSTSGWAIRSGLGLSATQFTALPVSGSAPAAGAPAASAPAASVQTAAAGGTTVLLIGTDRRPGERTARADALLLLRLDPRTGVASLLSLPRDLLVPVPGYGSMRINAAYQYGGLALQKRTVSNFTGTRIDYAVAINFSGFEGLINALGGITVNVPRRLVDAKYPTMNYGTMLVRFEPGVQHMNGSRALIYSRIRHPDSDFARMYRQQQVMAAIGVKLRALGVSGTLARAGTISSLLYNYVVTDMPLSAAGSLLWQAWQGVRTPRTYVVDLNYARPATVNGAYVLVPNRPAILGLVARWAGR